ncbi:MAG TPA: DUF4276 family protein [Rhodospirillales bacterium]|nr:DUF4276 family protein [Rhodospirillales bacterium]
MNQQNSIDTLINIFQSAVSPEHINDTPEGAPSKRIINVIPEYEGRKASAGPMIAENIGLVTIRKHCLHFDKWLASLEGLANPPLVGK